MFDTAQATEFWDWFAAKAPELHDAYWGADYDWLDAQFGPRIECLGDRINWEIGPYHPRDDSFVLSPTIRGNLPITRAVVAVAPKIPGWQLFHAKPPANPPCLKFTAHGCSANADDWRYRLIAYNQRQYFDIQIFIHASTDFPDAYEDLFCELVIESLIGEELRLERVGHLLPIIVDDNTGIEKATPIRHLKQHLDRVLAAVSNGNAPS